MYGIILNKWDFATERLINIFSSLNNIHVHVATCVFLPIKLYDITLPTLYFVMGLVQIPLPLTYVGGNENLRTIVYNYVL